jgi:tRNA threonylcarbamoyladenosine biosynthesis protein TsaB|nr:MAG: tRNA (adenosine(37)-N6)-threonylcarbamoyltransferase complex dimerization subunit type 1 TsaB [Bacteroidota bacterium]
MEGTRTRILALETATPTASVALLEGTETRLVWILERPQMHAERLMPAVEEALAHAGWRYEDLQAVAVSAGPGSYTGLRIGTSTAKGLCFALGIPLIPVPTLEALAWGVNPIAGHLGVDILAAIDARREHVYAALYRPGNEPELLWGPELSPISALVARLAGPVLLVGPGSRKSAHALQASAKESILLPDSWIRPSAEWVAQRAQIRLLRGQTADIASFEPWYLRDFVAGPARNPFS